MFQLNEPVIVRRTARTAVGARATEVLRGTVIAIRANGKALVSFPASRTRAEIDMSEMESARNNVPKVAIPTNALARWLNK